MDNNNFENRTLTAEELETAKRIAEANYRKSQYPDGEPEDIEEATPEVLQEAETILGEKYDKDETDPQ